ncbi:MAG: glycosyltransferase family 2 protein [Bacteroidota bacterium]
MSHPDISIVVPLFNEHEVFNKLVNRLQSVMDSCSYSVEVVLVDDGSKDQTSQMIQEIADKDKRFKGVLLSRNFGHQIALSAGMAHARCSKALMVIDGDLQDPPELLNTFYEIIQKDADVVYAVRKNRKEGAVMNSLYWVFYRMLNRLSEHPIPHDSGDFCMISKRVLDHMNDMPERSRFLRGIRSWVGFKQVPYEYDRDGRAEGKTKYSMKALFKLAYDGIFNFSNKPLKLITHIGLYTILLSVIYLTGVLIKKLLGYEVPSGFISIVAVITLFSGVQLISLGIIGEYLARIYLQVKNRPLYVVDKTVGIDN